MLKAQVKEQAACFWTSLEPGAGRVWLPNRTPDITDLNTQINQNLAFRSISLRIRLSKFNAGRVLRVNCLNAI